ncbi:STAS domain-containing protein [Aestuariibacter sp. AA17]|uniref:STAS domain-containing protein n=1 Tax=Fluctibacter corallii TaxID=2984329 RepID=A0ABT3AA68_9ALTE|nr:STAS domain-containing protein [Aestuariibacter sp. AA17]MCV2885570.1 STAS domain-containing protein [Aestuariibacter sp. AA17]
MSLERKISNDGKVLTIFMDEKFDFGKVQDFRNAYSTETEEINEVNIDLSQTEYMDSSALGMLLNMQKTLSGHVEKFNIINCRPQVAKILKISRFDKKFSIS